MQAALLQLAQAFVRGMFTPDLDHLSGTALRRGAYLLDLFLRLYVTESSQAQRLRLQLEHARSKLAASLQAEQMSFYPDDSTGHDQIAHTWGLSNGIRPASIPGLLDLQRRAYIFRALLDFLLTKFRSQPYLMSDYTFRKECAYE